MADALQAPTCHSTRMSYREFPTDPRLHAYVRTYWEVEEYHGPGDEEHHFMPERSVRLTFYAGQTFQSGPHGQALTLLPGAYLTGLNLQPLRVVSLGLTRALGAELYPWAARQLFGWSIEQNSLDLTTAHPATSRSLGALLSLGQWEEARQSLDAWLLGLLQERARQGGAAVQAAAELYRSYGMARIGSLAEALNLSQRQLERQFVREIGVNAKTLARLIRFEEVHNRIFIDPAQPLAPLAYDLGFADQAHLTREFKALGQITPASFAQYAREMSAKHEAYDIDTQQAQSRMGAVPALSMGIPPKFGIGGEQRA